MENFRKKDKIFLVRKRMFFVDSGSSILNESNGILFVDFVDDDSDFEVLSKLLVKRRVFVGLLGSKKKVMKIISFDDVDESFKCFGSVYNENGK